MEEAASSIGSNDYLDEFTKSEDHGQVKTIMEDSNAAVIILLKTFEYLSVRDLLNASQVSKLWNFVSSHNWFWRKINLDNCCITDYNGLFKKLVKYQTQELNIENAIFYVPDGMPPHEFWKKIFKRIKKVATLKKVKLGVCPINAIFKIAMAAPQLKSFSFSHLSRDKVNLGHLTLMNNLEEFTLKGTSFPIILKGVKSMYNLKNLKSLSLTKISNLCDLVSFLPIGLTSLELGWWFNGNFFDITDHKNYEVNMSPLSKLFNLENLCLSNENQIGMFLSDTNFLKSLNKLKCLKLDRVYSEDLLKCLPPGLRSLNFDWNNFEIDLQFLSKLTLLDVLAIIDHRKQLLLMNVTSFDSLTHLTSLTLKGIKNLYEIENYLPPSLVFLTMGDCYSLSRDFATNIVPTLINLKSLELEDGFDIFQTTDLLNVIAVMPRITHLSLINMEFKRDLQESISRCTNLTFLHISPYCSQDWDSLSVHQRIIYSVASLNKSLKFFNLGFDSTFLDIPNFINQNIVKVLSWNGPARNEELKITFVDHSCHCLELCRYPVHIIMMPIEAVEKEIFPQLLPETRAWITTSGLVGIYPDGKCVGLRVAEHSETMNIIELGLFENAFGRFLG